MKRRLVLGVLTLCTIVLVQNPADAGPATFTAEATSVALSSFSDCTSPAGLDIGMDNTTIEREGGIASDIVGELMSFDQGSGFSGYSGVFTGYNFSSPAWSVDEGAAVGLYAYIGTEPYDAVNTAEWFVLYACAATVPSPVLTSCFGPYGACPSTAREALVPVLDAVDASVDAGETLNVSGTGCWTTTAWATLTPEGGTASTVTDVEVAADGTFTIEVPVAADASGAAELEVGCGSPTAQDADGTAVESLQVVGTPTTTTTIATTTTTSAPAAVVTPRFTG